MFDFENACVEEGILSDCSLKLKVFLLRQPCIRQHIDAQKLYDLLAMEKFVNVELLTVMNSVGIENTYHKIFPTYK